MQSFKAVRLQPILVRPSISLRIFNRRSYEALEFCITQQGQVLNGEVKE